jgi:hypothetical protein
MGGIWRGAPTFSSLPDLVAFFSESSQTSGWKGLKFSQRVGLKNRRRENSFFSRVFNVGGRKGLVGVKVHR